jgi:hypothetical protein
MEGYNRGIRGDQEPAEAVWIRDRDESVKNTIPAGGWILLTRTPNHDGENGPSPVDERDLADFLCLCE